VAPLAHGSESKKCEAPVLNVTSVGKCPLKITGKKIRILGPSRFWDAKEYAYVSSPNYRTKLLYKGS
jgi:hypothetical protein